jgi:hypothetical protein
MVKERSFIQAIRFPVTEATTKRHPGRSEQHERKAGIT